MVASSSTSANWDYVMLFLASQLNRSLMVASSSTSANWDYRGAARYPAKFMGESGFYDTC